MLHACLVLSCCPQGLHDLRICDRHRCVARCASAVAPCVHFQAGRRGSLCLVQLWQSADESGASVSGCHAYPRPHSLLIVVTQCCCPLVGVCACRPPRVQCASVPASGCTRAAGVWNRRARANTHVTHTRVADCITTLTARTLLSSQPQHLSAAHIWAHALLRLSGGNHPPLCPPHTRRCCGRPWWTLRPTGWMVGAGPS